MIATFENNLYQRAWHIKNFIYSLAAYVNSMAHLKKWSFLKTQSVINLVTLENMQK